MTLEQLANLGEFVSGIAVIASLIYLAIQIKQNTQTVRGSTLATNTDIWASMLLRIASDDRSEAYMNGMLGKEDIDPKHFLQFILTARSMFISFEAQHYQYLHGALDEDIYLGYERACKNEMLAFPGFRMYWEITRDEFSPEFIKLVDRIIGEIHEEDSYMLITRWQQLARDLQAARRGTQPGEGPADPSD